MTTDLKELKKRLNSFKRPEPSKFTEQANEEFRKLCDQYMTPDLEKSGLIPEDVFAFYDPYMPKPAGAMTGYKFPYFNVQGYPITDEDGKLVMHRWRFFYEDGLEGPRYLGPSAKELAHFYLPTNIPYIPPATTLLVAQNGGSVDTLYIAEGEKKAASVAKNLGVACIGIGGCWSWKSGPDSDIHPWIKKIFADWSIRNVVVIPDGDVERFDIKTAYGCLDMLVRRELGPSNCKVLKLPSEQDKIDDLIGSGVDVDLDSYEVLAPEDLTVSKGVLADHYKLTISVTQNGNVVVHQHDLNVRKLLRSHPVFPKLWYNLDTDTIMVGDERYDEFIHLPRVIDLLQGHMQFEKIKRMQIAPILADIAAEDRRSPFLDGVKSSKWDGDERLDTWAIRHWGVEDSPYVREVSRKLLVASCARMDRPGCKVDWMFVVTGPQGIGKTAMPSLLWKGLDTIVYGKSDKKDMVLAIHSGLCIVIDEMDGFTKSDMTYWKSLISTPIDKVRRPYARVQTDEPRNSIMYGTSNLGEFLTHDPTGQRRWGILEARTLLDFDSFTEEVDQLWAEAWQVYQSGECDYWRIEKASEVAEQYEVDSPLKESCENFLQDWGTEEFQMTDVLRYLGRERESSNTGLTRELASLFRELGCKKGRRRIGENTNPRKCWLKPGL